MTITPNESDFLRQAQGRRMAVVGDILADCDTPLSAYWKLAHDEPLSFLLESVTGGESLARYSIIGMRPRHVLRTKGERVVLDDQGSSLGEGEDPLHRLSAVMGNEAVAMPADLPKFFGGAVGVLSYDFVRFLEQIPDSNPDDLGCWDMAMMLTDSAVVFDHARNRARLVVITEGTAHGYAKALAEIGRMEARLKAPLPPLPETGGMPHGETTSNVTREHFEDIVERTRQYIRAGDGIQMVLSQRLSRATEAHPVSIYRALRTLNPSPYMYLLRFGDFDFIGASPELLVSLQSGEARVRPIAGTRMRGKTEEEDLALEEELMASEKERSEHIMLVDLGRNDLGRVCEVGTVNVHDLMVVERYSHVMHIVSDVRGRLAEGKDAFDLVRATFPAGTLSGAPKVRAMQIIDDLENSRRGLYGGAVGYVAPNGDMDLAIAIRSVFLKDGKAHVQAGAGIVYDSDPAAEYQETLDKASACLRAIDAAESGL